MTRNNLPDNIAWLLKNAVLSKPTAPQFPQTSDTASFRSTQSQSTNGRTADLSQETTVSAGSDRRTNQAQSWSSNGPPKKEEASQNTEVVVLEDNSMGRLTLSSKSRKPVLLSQNVQREAPSSADGRSKQVLNESLKPNGAWINIVY